ncbi:response regulator [Desulfosoma caldarium]|uniref:Response regulator receiver domain-containing protein n=1 Tax=Desulfosoma caldarium TaxID=610254 RepID=A0A3N1VRX5_9BACT|nr:response regulator [Desulfosoma caldarium]ROR02992.1 response regulator receiver domain-containing protein [Desulfosoma caldarium]
MDKQPKMRVLILDDEPIVCKRMKPSFEKAGYEVETFTDSTLALERIREQDFDVVITDLKMEKIDGMRFLSEVKKRTPTTEVIVITGFATMETAKESFQKGVFDFVAKPFKMSEILDAVRRVEEKRRAARL